jgi:hypothetical protein
MAAPRNFAKYALCYDLLYRDKDYAAEAGYAGRLIRSATPAARSVLEFGCGTGRHARLLCTMGFDVHGVDHPLQRACSHSGWRSFPWLRCKYSRNTAYSSLQCTNKALQSMVGLRWPNALEVHCADQQSWFGSSPRAKSGLC